MDVKEIGLYYISWTYWNQDRKYWWVLRCTVPKLRIPKMEGIAWVFCCWMDQIPSRNAV